MKKIIALIVFAAAVAGIFAGIRAFNKSRIMVTPFNKDVASVTWQEYYGDEPKNKLMELHHDKSFSPDNYYFGEGYNKVMRKSKMPVRDGESLRYVITSDDGSETVVYEFSCNEHMYCEIPGVGMFSSISDWDTFDMTLGDYYEKIYYQDYICKMEDRSFVLPENYNGAGKAIWIDFSDNSPLFCNRIPSEYAAADPSEVRYLVVCYLDSSSYAGYWYERDTGKKVSDHYVEMYSLRAFDLMTGDETILVETTDDVFEAKDSETIRTYLENRKQNEG